MLFLKEQYLRISFNRAKSRNLFCSTIPVLKNFITMFHRIYDTESNDMSNDKQYAKLQPTGIYPNGETLRPGLEFFE